MVTWESPTLLACPGDSFGGLVREEPVKVESDHAVVGVLSAFIRVDLSLSHGRPVRSPAPNAGGILDQVDVQLKNGYGWTTE